jgi:hypothetical protein
MPIRRNPIDAKAISANLGGLEPVGTCKAAATPFSGSFEEPHLGDIPTCGNIGTVIDALNLTRSHSPPSDTCRFRSRFTTRRIFVAAPTRCARQSTRFSASVRESAIWLATWAARAEVRPLCCTHSLRLRSPASRWRFFSRNLSPTRRNEQSSDASKRDF